MGQKQKRYVNETDFLINTHKGPKKICSNKRALDEATINKTCFVKTDAEHLKLKLFSKSLINGDMKRLINQMQNLQRNEKEKKRYKGKPQNETQVKFYTQQQQNTLCQNGTLR